MAARSPSPRMPHTFFGTRVTAMGFTARAVWSACRPKPHSLNRPVASRASDSDGRFGKRGKRTMAKVYRSAVIEAPVQAVWDYVRDFNALPKWHPAIATSEIEAGSAADR